MKIEKIQERVLRSVNNYHNFDYSVLLSQSGQVTMEVKRMRYLCLEIYESLNGHNPSYINDILSRNVSLYSSRRRHDLSVPRVNKTTFGLKSVRYEVAKTWNHLPESINSAENLHVFKQLRKAWRSPTCKSKFCKSSLHKTNDPPEYKKYFGIYCLIFKKTLILRNS